MVRKLFKHEFAALGRILLPTYAIMLIIAVGTRIVQFFRVDHLAYQLAFFGAASFFFLACIVCALMTMVVGVVRYYTHFFTRQGYLTFTLPATPTQQLWVKLLSLLLFYLFATVTIMVSALVAIRWDLLFEIIKAAVYLLESLFTEINIGVNLAVLAAEYLVLMAVGTVVGILILYTCMNIGQLAHKARIVWSIVAYFAYEAIVYAISTVLQVVLTALPLLLMPLMEISFFKDLFTTIGTFFESYPFVVIHSVMALSILGQLVFCVVLFLVSRYILKRRLNLE